jgi:hypothetical protein
MERIKYSIVACALMLMAASCGRSDKKETASIDNTSVIETRSFAGYKAEREISVRPEAETVDGLLGNGSYRDVPQAIPGGILPEVTINATPAGSE